jgi:hypothetical protein
MKLNEKAFGISAAIVCAAGSLLGYLGMSAGMMGGAGMMDNGMMMHGGLVGLIFHVVIAFVAGYAFAWVYNMVVKG